MSHLAQAERYHIFSMLQLGHTQAWIAAALGRAPSTISRKLQRNSTSGRYDLDQARKTADRHRNQTSSGMRVDQKVMAAVQDKVQRLHWSPQAALGRLYKETGIWSSVQTVYNHLAALPHPLGRFVKRYRPRGRVEKRGRIPGRVALELRPRAVEERNRWGDFEADLMLGLLLGCYVIAVMIERRSRYVRLFLLENRRAETVNKALRRAVSECPVRARTITVDNGKEFAGHRELGAQTGTQVFFTEPYCAYQKGTVEHFIGVLRRKLPKRTDFSKLTRHGVKQVEHWLNNRPLKVLDYRTQKEVYTITFGVMQLSTLSGLLLLPAATSAASGPFPGP